MTVRPTSCAAGRVGPFAAGVYVTVVAVLTAYSFRPGNHDFSTAEVIAAGLTVPAILPALPVVYVVGATAWNLTDGAATWAITVTFTSMMVVVALANVTLWRWFLSHARRAS